jgi:uncharacterized lipoprotein YddW (UPF0748 family)
MPLNVQIPTPLQLLRPVFLCILCMSLTPLWGQTKMRAAWVASVANTDWPSQKGLSVAQQQKECRELLDLAVQLKLNTIIFQVRPHGDALYKSSFEPWSDRLTGIQGKYPGYDPLQYWIDQCHKRQLKIHAWFNPYRVQHPTVKEPLAKNSLQRKANSWCIYLKKGYVWLNPASKAVRQYVQTVILDCARRYNIDGIHLDDYFYPYKDFLPPTGFPDHKEYSAYIKTKPSKIMNKEMWRRHQVNTLIYSLHKGLKRLKPQIEFGISPFGIWKPGYPRDVKGTSAFDNLACDSRRWLREGWVDYLSPQLYWPESAPQQRFSSLLNWWKQQNPLNKKLVPGLASWRTEPKELINQMKRCEYDPKVHGFSHFSLGAIQKDSYLKKQLINYGRDRK